MVILLQIQISSNEKALNNELPFLHKACLIAVEMFKKGTVCRPNAMGETVFVMHSNYY